MASRCRHVWTRVEVQAEDRCLHLVCGACGYVDPRRSSAHEWERPGRERAHGRPLLCLCHSYVLAPLVYATCGSCGPEQPHHASVRERGGLRLSCAICARAAAAEREIDPEVSRAASRDYQRRKREGALDA